MKFTTLLFFLLFLIACDSKSTHTMQEAITDIVTDNRRYQGETITLKAKVVKVTPHTANKDKIWLFTNNDAPPTFDFVVIADREHHRPEF